ncbi:MAG: hypothetical protein H7A42_00755 [Chlamydiales bacterium]|nr:hypothetical protein [Chlamydiales bacterium]
MNYQENMLIAINNQSSTISGLQISQANSTELMAEVLNAVYQNSQDQLSTIMQMMAALNAFYTVMNSESLSDFFETYFSGGNPPKGQDDLSAGAMQWWTNFNNQYGGTNHTENGCDGINDPTFQSHGGHDFDDSYFDKTEDWSIGFTIDGNKYQVTGDQFVNNFQSYLGMAQSEYQEVQTSFSNLEQGDQTSLQDLQSGVQSTAQAGSNLLSTGSSMIQAMGYTSSLLESPM